VTIIAQALPLSSWHKLRRKFRLKISLSKVLQLRFNLFLMSHSPIWAVKAYIWVLARVYFACRPGQVKRIRKNIAKALRDRTPSEVDKITRGVIKGTIQHYQEKMINGFLPMPKFRKFLVSRVVFDGYERVLQDAIKEGRGVIIASAHYGALEFLPIYLAVRKYGIATLAKFATERLRNITVPRANGDGLEIVVPGNGTNVFREASKVLSENKIFVTQCDETDAWHADNKEWMEFLGRKIHPDRMLNVLCKRTGAVLLFGVLHRENKKEYKLLLRRVPCEGNVPTNVRTLKMLEEYIREHPEQWYEWKKYSQFGDEN
jgi:lauroyl/myristoyl acyltransferase